jgi:hypothetical protein
MVPVALASFSSACSPAAETVEKSTVRSYPLMSSSPPNDTAPPNRVVPFTSSKAEGLLVPIPRLPLPSIVIAVVLALSSIPLLVKVVKDAAAGVDPPMIVPSIVPPLISTVGIVTVPVKVGPPRNASFKPPTVLPSWTLSCPVSES